MIVIQQIRMQSSHVSRVGPGSQRSGVPEAMDVPLNRCDLSDSAMLQHLWGGSTPGGRVLTQSDLSPITLGCVTVDPGEEFTRVSFSWSWQGGAPARWWAEKSFELRPGEWVRMMHNGCFSGWESYWWYEKTVLNVGMFDTIQADLFTRGGPSYRYELFSRLW
jgi:hypothetical protein